MTVRDTSAESHAINGHDQKKWRIREYVRLHGPCTRRQIAQGLGFETASVSGMVTPLVNQGFLDEVGKGICPVTGRQAYLIESPVEQLRLIA